MRIKTKHVAFALALIVLLSLYGCTATRRQTASYEDKDGKREIKTDVQYKLWHKNEDAILLKAAPVLVP